MRIVLDLQSLQTASRNRGIGRYSLNLAEAMARRAGEHQVVIALNGAFQGTIEPLRERFRDLVPPENIRVWSQLAPTAGLVEANRWRARASELVREHALYELAPDIVHVTSLFEGLGDDAVTSIGLLTSELPTAVTLYDLIPFLHPEHYLADPIRKAWYLRKLRSLQAADLLLAISEHSRREAIDTLDLDPESVVAIQADADARFGRLSLTEEAAASLLERHGLHRRFIMYTGVIEHRKNLDRLIESYARLAQGIRQAYQLAIVSKIEEADRTGLLALCRRLGLRRDDVVFIGHVSDDDLVGLYNLCELFVLPSLHEGFGLPALEAMRCGAPVIGSDCTSIPEVIGRSDALFDPTSVEAIAAKLTQALTDDGFRASLRDNAATQARKFSWDETARKVLEAFEGLHARLRKQHLFPAGRRRPRLAYVSPLPPERSGIATYSAELLPELARYYEIELITDLESVDDPWLDAAFPRRSTTWFEAHADRYDRILYHFGNSSFHTRMFSLLRQCSGAVVLHDFFFSEVMRCMDTTGQEAGVFQRALYYSHGWRALAMLASDGAEAAVRAFPCNREVLENAQGIIVHGADSSGLGQQWYGRDSVQEWQLVPPLEGMLSDNDAVNARRQLGCPTQDPVPDAEVPRAVAARYAEAIEHFARIHPLAMRHRLVKELSSVAGSDPGASLELVPLARSIAENTAPSGPKQILVDITIIAGFDLKTGVQRVTRAVLGELLDRMPPGYRIEPVYRSAEHDRYHYARAFTQGFLGLEPLGMEDAPVHVAPGDVFLGLDLDPVVVSGRRNFLRHHQARGLRTYFVVYDLLPILGPQWFPPGGFSTHKAWLDGLAEVTHGFVCISRAVADEVAGYLETAGNGRRIDVGYFHLGSDVEASRPSRGLQENEALLVGQLRDRYSLLMVGTLEPRKGYGQALDAMERLWAQGDDMALVIVGKQGWMVDPLVERLRRHPEAGRRLLWFERASDEVLERLYQKASALLMASEGEGFGLPIIEAARYGVPVIARDLPVFREVAGQHAFYFSGTDGARLADALQEWLALHRRGEVPSVAGMPILTWAESTRQLLDVILGGNWYRTVMPGSAGNGGEATQALVPAGGQPPAAPSMTRDEERLAAAKP